MIKKLLLSLLLFLPALSLAQEAAAPKVGASVKVISTGSGAKTALRFAPQKGDKQAIAMTMTMAMEMSMGGQAMPAMKVPQMLMTLDLEVIEITAENDIRYVFKLSKADIVDDPAVMAQVKEAMRASLQQMVGLSGKVLVSPRGITKETSIEYPPGVDAQTRQMMEGMKDNINQLSAPLPEEEVGQGAQWEASTTVSQNGITLTQVTTYTLAEVGGGRATMKLAVTQKAEPQEMKMPGLPPGTTARLDELTSGGEGEMRLDLAHLAPTTSTVNIKTDMRSTISMGEMKQPMSMKLELGMTMESK